MGTLTIFDFSRRDAPTPLIGLRGEQTSTASGYPLLGGPRKKSQACAWVLALHRSAEAMTLCLAILRQFTHHSMSNSEHLQWMLASTTSMLPEREHGTTVYAASIYMGSQCHSRWKGGRKGESNQSIHGGASVCVVPRTRTL